MTELKLVRNQNNDFKKSFALSFAFHGAVISLFLVKYLFFSEPFIDLSQAITVNVGELAQNSKLPSKAENPEDNKLPPKVEEPPAQPEPEVVAETKPKAEVKPEPAEPKKADKAKSVKDKTKDDTIALNKTKAKQVAALNKLKKKSAIDKIRQDLKKDSIAKLRAQLRNSAAAASEPHIIPAGSALTGLDKLQAGNYLQALDQNVKEYWALPQWLINKPLKAQLLLKIDGSGKILTLKVISTSGNSSYDKYCLQAVEKAAPFPEVPEKLSEKFRVDGIIIGFPE